MNFFWRRPTTNPSKENELKLREAALKELDAMSEADKEELCEEQQIVKKMRGAVKQ